MIDKVLCFLRTLLTGCTHHPRAVPSAGTPPGRDAIPEHLCTGLCYDDVHAVEAWTDTPRCSDTMFIQYAAAMGYEFVDVHPGQESNRERFLQKADIRWNRDAHAFLPVDAALIRYPWVLYVRALPGHRAIVARLHADAKAASVPPAGHEAE
jgi:hypothetical protein